MPTEPDRTEKEVLPQSEPGATADAEEPEVVAHFDDGEDLPWCISCAT